MPKCCPSGKLTYDACGCCEICAKGEDEICGGPSGTSGHCAKGLNCLKKCKKVDIFQCEGRCIDKSKIERTLVESSPNVTISLVTIIEENLTQNNTVIRTCNDTKGDERNEGDEDFFKLAIKHLHR